ncbi:MAG TPA: hypothetical protein VFB33_15045 [Candidatus Binataceae bacterium]|nr:hypothetical protein [Candidatus Binataceae bacterium]
MAFAKPSRGQAAVEFALASIVAMIVLFIAIQFALIGSYAVALAQLNFMAARWVTGPKNEAKVCTPDLVNFITTNAGAFMSRVISAGGVSCAGSGSPTPDGITISMLCVPPSGAPPNPPSAPGPCPAAGTSRLAGTEVKISMTMGTRSIIFLSRSTPPSFFGIPFPSSLNSVEAMSTE